MITLFIYTYIWIQACNKDVKIKNGVNFKNLYALILYKENHLKTFIAYVKKPICWGFPTNTLYFLYTNKYLYNQCIKLFYLFYIHHCSIYILDHIRRPFLIKICCSMVRNVPFHEKNVSVKFQWNRFIFRWSTKPLKNAFLLKKLKF